MSLGSRWALPLWGIKNQNQIPAAVADAWTACSCIQVGLYTWGWILAGRTRLHYLRTEEGREKNSGVPSKKKPRNEHAGCNDSRCSGQRESAVLSHTPDYSLTDTYVSLQPPIYSHKPLRKCKCIMIGAVVE